MPDKQQSNLIATVLPTFVTVIAGYYLHRRFMQAQLDDLTNKRQEERTGRIRAEVKLRNALSLQKNSSMTISDEDPHMMKLATVGIVVSPYTKRMGTPRQGLLVPSSRGYIQFSKTVSPEAVDGIMEYGYLWVIFAFHANTSLATSKKTKIRPPRAGGVKVGMLATRSPHRVNDLGLSLVKINRWEPSLRRLHINALDLVNGTPVYDIKPYVHWDIPPEISFDSSKLRLPPWVENKDDVLASVEVDQTAKDLLEKFVKQNRLAPLYPSKDSSSVAAAMQTLTEILAQDPRSSHKGVSKNQRGSLSTENYKLLFCGLEVEFVVEATGAKVLTITIPPKEREGE